MDLAAEREFIDVSHKLVLIMCYSFVSLAPSLIAQISDVRQIGVRTGTLFAVIAIAALISNPIGGELITRWNGSFTGLQIYCGVMTFAG